jgi:MFS family permease
MKNENSLLSSNADEKDIPHRYTMVIGTFLVLLSLGLVMSSFGVFFKPVSEQFGWTRAETSGAFSVSVLWSGLMSIIAGRLADKFSPRLIILSFSAIGGCACLLLSQMKVLWQFYFFYGILIGTTMASLIPTTSLVTRFYKKQRGLMTGITISGLAFGSILAAPIITKLIDNYNWRTSYIIIGVVVLVIIAFSALFLRDPIQSEPLLYNENSLTQKRISKRDEVGFKIAVRSGPFWILGILFFCAVFAQQMIIVHLIPHATDVGISPIIAATILSVTHGGYAGGSFVTGRINDLIGSRQTMVIAMVIALIALILLLIADKMWILYVFAILFGISWGGTATIRSTIAAELFGLHSHGAITGVILFISTIGGAISPLVAGYIFDLSSGYQLTFLITIGICIVGLVMAWLLKSGPICLPNCEMN